MVVNNTPRPVSDDSAAVIERQRIQVRKRITFRVWSCVVGNTIVLTTIRFSIVGSFGQKGYGGRHVAFSAGQDL